METGCLEIVVNKKTNTLVKAMCICAGVLAVCFCFIAFAVSFLFMIPAILCLVGFYFAWLESKVDYEYAYVDKEIRVAKIQQKQRRKELAVYDLTKMEVLAPVGSYHLDPFKNKEGNTVDYSSGTDEDVKNRYVLILSDGTRLILDLAGEYGAQVLDIIRMSNPRKVFKD